MKIFNSGLNDSAITEFHRRFLNEKLNVLMAYDGTDGHVNFFSNHQDKIKSTAIDSGAFSKNSAEERGLSVNYDLYSYADERLLNASPGEMYFNFDERFDTLGFDLNMRNQRYLESLGLTPIPVIHNYDIRSREFQFFIKNRPYPIVALGKVKKKTAKTIFRPATELYNAGVKVFLLGGSGFSKLAYAPIAFCDSTSWCKYPMHGQVCFWDEEASTPEKTRIIHFSRDEIQWEDDYRSRYKFWDRFISYVNTTCGYTFYDLVGPRSNLVRQVINLKFFRMLEEEVTRIHKQLGFKTAT